MDKVTMKRSHFRLKVDLSNFFHDARRFCWVFIDGTKIQQVIHMKQHISKLFNIEEPFHLLLNNTEYLPPIEDVRILQENETILVVPGSGINNEVPVVETSNDSVYNNQETNIKTGMVAQDVSNNIVNTSQPTPTNNTTRDMTFYSVASDTMVNHSGEDTESKTDNLTEDSNIIDSFVSVTKRKRVRKRRLKNRSQLITPPNIIEENLSKEPISRKPRIIDSYIIQSGKHIRFDNMENNENDIAKQTVQEPSGNESSSSSKASSSRELSTLLTLAQSSTPLTFVNKQLKNEVKMESVLNDEIRSQNLNKTMEDSIEKDLCSKEPKKTQNYKNFHADLEKVPVMLRKPQVNDVIAFRILKIGMDYTPQMSNFIFTRALSFCAQSGNYTLQILHGKEEIQVPTGKFFLSEDESENHSNGDTFVVNYSQMIDLRLISLLLTSENVREETNGGIEGEGRESEIFAM